jgi:hypothetical protein
MALSTGQSHDICAILADRTVTCWNHARAPSLLAGLSDVVSISLSSDHGCTAHGDGTVRCWGKNATGQLGNGTRDDSDAPVLALGVGNAVGVAVGGNGASIGRSCALLRDGSAACWGRLAGPWEPENRVESTTPLRIRF